MLYPLIRPLLFRLKPEAAHHATLRSLHYLRRWGVLRYLFPSPASAPCRVMGLEFPNRVGLAAGLDKNGEYIDELAALGFGFIEVGTVTPRPQPGNPQPRIFRLPAAKALINRMGFNNMGVDYLLEHLRETEYSGILGINLGKNFDTPLEKAVDDYLIGLRKVYAHADYVTINISSPNTPGLRNLQYGTQLQRMLETLKSSQSALKSEYGRYVPLVIKIAPDMDTKAIHTLSRTLLRHEIDGVIATNTTFSRKGVENLKHSEETGGLSGLPLLDAATECVREIHRSTSGRLPIIAVGGITEGRHALDKIHAGASLVQLYTGLIYRGPGLVRGCLRALNRGQV